MQIAKRQQEQCNLYAKSYKIYLFLPYRVQRYKIYLNNANLGTNLSIANDKAPIKLPKIGSL